MCVLGRLKNTLILLNPSKTILSSDSYNKNNK